MLLNLLYACAGLLLIPYFLYRRWVLKKASAGLAAKLGRAPRRTAGHPRFWIHSVSVGETLAAETLVLALKRAFPGCDVVVSTTTVTGQEVARKKYGAENCFYYPLDFTFAVNRALDAVQPSVVILMELEVWPNFSAICERRGIPLLVANGRITERAARRYRRFWWLVGPSFRRVTRWLAQTAEYAQRLRELGVDAARIEIAGNIKYDALDTVLKPAERGARRRALSLPEEAPVLVGGSTHPTEEAALLDALKELRAGACPELRMILVPRHPERTAAVETEIRAAGFVPVRFSALKAGEGSLAAPESVLLVDTVGELKGMYVLADAAFVGGSLIPHGGQNIMEPCGLGIPALHGPHMHNFNEAMEILAACGGAFPVERATLAAELARVFTAPDAARERASRAREAFLARQGATARTVEVLRGMELR